MRKFVLTTVGKGGGPAPQPSGGLAPPGRGAAVQLRSAEPSREGLGEGEAREPASLEGGDRDNDAVPVALRRHLRAAGTQDDGRHARTPR